MQQINTASLNWEGISDGLIIEVIFKTTPQIFYGAGLKFDIVDVRLDTKFNILGFGKKTQ